MILKKFSLENLCITVGKKVVNAKGKTKKIKIG